MVTYESLQEQYTKLEVFDLLEIYTNKEAYTELAQSVALEELKKRKVPKQDIDSYKPVLIEQNDPEVLKNYLIDLKLWQKIVFYFVWIPRIRSYFTYNFAPEGFILKSNQCNFYSVIGFVFCMLSGIISSQYHYPFVTMWGAGFLVAHAFDILYNKQRQIDGMQKKVDEGKVLKV